MIPLLDLGNPLVKSLFGDFEEATSHGDSIR
jgi:hypothetical protein